MYCPDKLKLNKFRLVRIPSNESYFARYGMQSSDNGSYAPTPIPFAENKIDTVSREMNDYNDWCKCNPSSDE